MHRVTDAHLKIAESPSGVLCRLVVGATAGASYIPSTVVVESPRHRASPSPMASMPYVREQARASRGSGLLLCDVTVVG